MGDLRKEVTLENLSAHFIQVSPKFNILQLRSSRGLYQIAFVKFDSWEEAEQARLKSAHVRLLNKPMRVVHMKSKEDLEKMLSRLMD